MTEHERQLHVDTSGPCVSSERPAPGHIQCVQSALFVWISTEKYLMHYVTLCGARPYDLKSSQPATWVCVRRVWTVVLQCGMKDPTRRNGSTLGRTT